MRQRQNAAPKKPGNVKHRVIGEDHIFGTMRHDDGVGPALVGHAAMQDAHQRGRAGGAAAVHIGADVVRFHRSLETQLVPGMPGHGQIEVRIGQHPAPGTFDRKDVDAGQLIAHALQTLPHLVARGRTQRNHHLRL